PSRRAWKAFLPPLCFTTLVLVTSGALRRLPTDSFSSARRIVSSSGSSAMVDLPQVVVFVVGGGIARLVAGAEAVHGVAGGGLLGLLLGSPHPGAVRFAVDRHGHVEGAGVVGPGGLDLVAGSGGEAVGGQLLEP